MKNSRMNSKCIKLINIQAIIFGICNNQCYQYIIVLNNESNKNFRLITSFNDFGLCEFLKCLEYCSRFFIH